jgi:hypothetical protein
VNKAQNFPILPLKLNRSASHVFAVLKLPEVLSCRGAGKVFSPRAQARNFGRTKKISRLPPRRFAPQRVPSLMAFPPLPDILGSRDLRLGSNHG